MTTSHKKRVPVGRNGECNPRQLAFIEEYISNGFNSTRAYIKAYEKKESKENMNSIWVNANRVLTSPRVQKELKKRQSVLTF